LQARQAPWQAFSQHTPSTHWLESHWLASVQGWPFLRLPLQTPVVTPFAVWATHWCPGSHALGRLGSQLVSHAPLLHRKGAQSMSSWGRQVPRPSQVRGVFCTRPEHDEGPHTLFSG